MAVCEELKTGLMLLGATAVEDKLQEGVPEAIAALSAAGIKVSVVLLVSPPPTPPTCVCCADAVGGSA